MPDKLWEHPEIKRLPEPTAADTSATHQALQAIWQLHVRATFRAIWKWRTAADAPEDLWTTAQAVVYHEGSLRATLASPCWHRTCDSAASSHTAALIQILRQTRKEESPQPAEAEVKLPAQYLLFLDGGSRGNPGPGGSGAVIVHVSHQATRASVIWSAAMSAAQKTATNNQAEYDGVIHGLRAARTNNWSPLEVVGDSQLILRQLRDYRPPRNEKLRAAYATARRLADSLGVRQWNHHLRSYNKMADAAANVAMDSRPNSQVSHPTERTQHAQLERHQSTDFADWQTNYFARH
jgi:ribonuclease HI